MDLKAIRFIPNSKVSHDYDGSEVHTFSYRELIQLRSPAIGIPCIQNGLIVIDVDIIGDTHKHDGREFWGNFCKENGIPQTYTVTTRSGGYHFYFRLPPSLNLDMFRPPATLADGVDVKFRGWVGAPPTPGYEILAGNVNTIAEAPPSLLAFMSNLDTRGTASNKVTFDTPAAGMATFHAHKPFSEHQMRELRSKITWLQTEGSLDRSEWRDGLFSLKAGVDDPVVLDELVELWTMNKNYVEGDEDEARSIIANTDKYGSVGPGTIFAIIKAVMRREGANAIDSPYTSEEIINRSRVTYTFSKTGELRVEASESNASSIVGAIHDKEALFHDIKNDQYMYKGKPYSDQELVNILMPQLQSTYAGLGLEKFRKNQICSGLEILMAARQIDPHAEYLSKLIWDGQPRIEQFFQKYVGVEDSPYHRKVSKNFWTALAARGMRPGCKFDSVLILEGAEGIRKSSLVEAIGGDYTFAPSRRDAFENLDELRKMHQSTIVELPELMGLVNENAEKVKAFLASPFDIIRALYARKATKQPRGFVFIGTTNSDKYISATMGLRRFWPVKIPASTTFIDIDGVKANRDQLFAEAINYYRDGYPFYDMPEEYLRAQTANKVMTDPLTDAIQDQTADLVTATTSDIYRRLEAAGFISRGFTPAIKNRIDSVLIRIGFESTVSGGWQRTNPLGKATSFCGVDLESLV